MSISRRPRSGL